jgi:hypothetical protein
MNHNIPDLRIHVHKLDGSISTFAQDDTEKSKKILDGFQPMEIFNRQKIVLADKNSHTTFPVAQITRIDLDSEKDSHLIFEGGIVEAVELSKTEFETLVQNLSIHDQWKNLGEQNAFVVTFLNVEMADGHCVLLTMEVDAESPQGLSELRDYLLNRPGLCFRMRNGGVAVLNLTNLARITFFPGTFQPPQEAWNVRLVEIKETANLPNNAVPQAPSHRPALSVAQREETCRQMALNNGLKQQASLK